MPSSTAPATAALDPAGLEAVLEVMSTARAMRHFHPDPVPDEVVTAMVHAATRAPSGKNAQPWAFVAIRDEAVRREVGALYREAWYETMPQTMQHPTEKEWELRGRRDWEYLANHMGDAPLLVLVCYVPQPHDSMPDAPSAEESAGSLYPAIQNLLLAARAYGVGGCLTTVHQAREEPIKRLLGVPDEVETVALIPMGYPLRSFGPVSRKPLAEVGHWDRWGVVMGG